MEEEKTTLVCENPVCRKQFKFPTPVKAGAYTVPCPHCGWKNHFTVQYTVEEEDKKHNVGLQSDGSYLFVCPNEKCKKIVLVPAKMVVKGHNKVACPLCGSEYEFEVLQSENELLKCQGIDCKGYLEKPNRGDGIYGVSCKDCGLEYSLLIQNGRVVKTILKTPPPPPLQKQCSMKLVVGHLFNKKEYILSKGVHYIGRFDEECNSDFNIKDKYASKRSIKIEVNLNGENLIYKLTVEKATNPVYHNNKELAVGDIVYITYGDTIQLGKTLIRIQKCK